MVNPAFVAGLFLLAPLSLTADHDLQAFTESGSAEDMVHIQEDGGVPGDAPNSCLEATPDRTVNPGSASTSGMLLEPDDQADAYVMSLAAANVGDRLRLDLLSGLLTSRHDVAFDVFAPGCGSSVFDPESAYYNPAPPVPVEAGAGQAVVSAGLEGYDCNASEWKFLGNQMGGIPAPATIYVEWANGKWAYVPVSKSTPATVAMYRTDANLDAAVTKALIVLPESYKGQFKLVHGPCDVSSTPSPPPQLSATSGEFTVQESGPHIVVVYIARGTVDKSVATIEDLLANPPTSVNANCHRDICTLGFDFVSYDVGSNYM